MEPDRRLRIPAKGVAADILDDEVVVVNLVTGHYFSTDGAGCDVWRLLAAGVAVGSVAPILVDRYEGDPGEIAAYVDELVERIVGAGLMVAVDEGDGQDIGPAASDVLPSVDAPLPFAPAPFLGFDDMESLLLLDPVHDVDDRGWPHAAGD